MDRRDLRVLRGSPTEEELIAATVVLLAVMRREQPAAAGGRTAGRVEWRPEGYRPPGAWTE